MSAEDTNKAVDLMDKAWTMRREAAPKSKEELRRIYDQIQQLLSDAATICRRAGAMRELVDALGKLAHVEHGMGNSAAALVLYEEAVDVARQAGDPMLLAHSLRHVGDLHRGGGRPEAAEPHYVEALALYRGHDQAPKLDLANALRPMAILKEDAGVTDEARKLWIEARDLYQAVGIQEGVDECSDHLAALDRSDRESP